MSWFVLRTAFRHEASIVSTIAAFGPPFRAYCPMNETRWISHQKDTLRITPMFPTYVFVDWEPKTPGEDYGVAWHRVSDLPGAGTFIGGEFPMPLREEELNNWIVRTDENGIVRGLDQLLRKLKRGFDRGDLIRVIGGAFDDKVGKCIWSDDRGVRVEFALFAGREQEVYLRDVDCRFRLESEAVERRPKRNRDYLTNLARAQI